MIDAGVQLSFRTAADDFVYVYVTSSKGLDEEAIELARIRKSALEFDTFLWPGFKALLSAWLNRAVAEAAGIELKEIRSMERRPKDEKA